MIWSSGKACGGCQCTPGSNADRCEAWEFELDITDFDGDALNITLCLDGKMTNLLETFKPYYNVKQLDRPGRVSGHIYVSKSLVGSLAQYLETEKL